MADIETLNKYTGLINSLKALANTDNAAGMSRFGISNTNTLGVSVKDIRHLAKEAGHNHTLALLLWDSGIHEARIMASLIAESRKVSQTEMESWVKDIDSWDICDLCCNNLWSKTSFAFEQALKWTYRPEEYIKRAGFVLLTTLAVHDKKALDEKFISFFPRLLTEASDERNYVKKAVNWALRQIGKRNLSLNQAAITLGEEILAQNTGSARFIATDALRELKSPQVQKRLAIKQEKQPHS
ncbi:DNA alkylation repair protein [Dehalococcoides mccartyi]|uniref:DNA alkylation repair protein n=1 Tax=Dehalococcoides mccartyi TaxID=61435 RepID=UPI0003C84DD1|nr:DNA alkylation repair protein [Dehalococcoides mccartyi]AHB13291.1 DNA alkylation repair enzyme-like protein [Dehalococcoides mccartyi GY50]AII57722.1 DNA alkylation repair protein [Dehalococcoides mccartyi CG1]APH12205.1 DNA alkylation repair protein [Dehalococcoides mccartyi]